MTPPRLALFAVCCWQQAWPDRHVPFFFFFFNFWIYRGSKQTKANTGLCVWSWEKECFDQWSGRDGFCCHVEQKSKMSVAHRETIAYSVFRKNIWVINVVSKNVTISAQGSMGVFASSWSWLHLWKRPAEAWDQHGICVTLFSLLSWLGWGQLRWKAGILESLVNVTSILGLTSCWVNWSAFLSADAFCQSHRAHFLCKQLYLDLSKQV